jgi:hypothetical protein
VEKSISGVLGILVMALISCSGSGPSRADMEAQINRVQAALGQARSWHISSTFAANGGVAQLEEDVGCPFNYHRVGRVPGRLPDEIIHMEGGYYSHEDGQWTLLHPPANDYCKDGPQAGTFPLAETLERLKPEMSIAKRELQVIGGVSCRDYDLIGLESPHYKLGSLCIDEQTNLPVEYRRDKDVFQYSKWNEPVVLEPPIP